MSYSKADIPDFLENVGAQLTDAEQRIDTDILEPVVFSDSFIRYELQNKGLLNPKSRFCFSLKDPTHACIYPLGVGVGSLIQRVALKIGGKTICEVDDWAHYHFYKSLFTDQQVVKDRESYMSARGLSNAVVYEDNTNTSKLIGMDLGKEFTVNASAIDTAMTVPTHMEVGREGVFSITLDDLVPALRSVSVPLFMLKEPVSIELTLSSTIGKRVSFASNHLAEKDTAVLLDQDECRMVADYTFLDGDQMEQYARANSTFEFTFLEPRMTKTTLANATAWTNQIRNVGGAGRRVPKMFVMLTSDKMGKNASDEHATSHNQMTLLNDYRAIAVYSGTESAGNYAKLTANIKKNDQFIYPIDRSNSALHYHGVQQAEGAVPHIPRTMYARQGNAFANNKFEGYVIDQENQLPGQAFVQAFRMPDGQRVDSRGLEIQYKYSALNADEAPYIQRVYIEIEKRVSIVDGVVDCYYE
jgi:hypothetical protein